MKYKLLLTGNNSTMIDDFFTRLSNHFECQNTSSRYEDILSHIQYFKPEAFIYCMQQEDADILRKVAAIKRHAAGRSIPFILVGSSAECDLFSETAGNISDLTLTAPIGTSQLCEQIIAHLQKSDATMTQADEEEAPSDNDEYSELLDMLENAQKDLSDFSADEDGKPRRKHILVVDDDSRMLKVINRHLAEHYDVATAINGRLALKFLETKRTDLVLLDYEMPLDNGLTVLEKIRANPATHNLPVVFLTGTSERRKIQKALALKPQGYLLKPIDHIKLLSTIKSLIG